MRSAVLVTGVWVYAQAAQAQVHGQSQGPNWLAGGRLGLRAPVEALEASPATTHRDVGGEGELGPRPNFTSWRKAWHGLPRGITRS